MDFLISLDTQLLYWINGHYCLTGDAVFGLLSRHWFIGVVVTLLFALQTLRVEPKRWWIMLICIGLSFLLADRLSVLCFKDVVCRLRPCHALEGVRTIQGCGGQYGFVSSHSANVFSIAMLFALSYRRQARWLPWAVFAWAFLVGYSRAYLGVHYPLDIICGGLLGLLTGTVCYFVRFVIIKRIERCNNISHTQRHDL